MKYLESGVVRAFVYIVSLAVLSGVFLLSSTGCAAKEPALKIGDKAPPIDLEDANGKKVKLSDFKDKDLVLIAFYPKDESSVCTEEMKNFAKDYKQFTGLNVEIVGISGDSVKSHGSFAANHGLKFVLLSDNKHKVSKAYGAYNKWLRVSGRAYFVVDKAGIIRYALVEKSLGQREENSALLKVVKDILAEDKAKSKKGK